MLLENGECCSSWSASRQLPGNIFVLVAWHEKSSHFDTLPGVVAPDCTRGNSFYYLITGTLHPLHYLFTGGCHWCNSAAHKTTLRTNPPIPPERAEVNHTGATASDTPTHTHVIAGGRDTTKWASVVAAKTLDILFRVPFEWVCATLVGRGAHQHTAAHRAGTLGPPGWERPDFLTGALETAISTVGTFGAAHWLARPLHRSKAYCCVKDGKQRAALVLHLHTPTLFPFICCFCGVSLRSFAVTFRPLGSYRAPCTYPLGVALAPKGSTQRAQYKHMHR